MFGWQTLSKGTCPRLRCGLVFVVPPIADEALTAAEHAAFDACQAVAAAVRAAADAAPGDFYIECVRLVQWVSLLYKKCTYTHRGGQPL